MTLWLANALASHKKFTASSFSLGMTLAWDLDFTLLVMWLFCCDISVVYGFFFCIQRYFLTESNECSSEEDLLDLCSSLRDSEYFRDLQLGSTEPPDTRLPVLTAPVSAPLVPPASTPESGFRQNSTEFNTHQLFQTDETVISTGGEAMDRLVAIRNSEQNEFQDYPESDQDEDSDMDNFPIFVRSMSTSRRHSWGAPVSPIDLGRR